jgi:hypothetical protein
MEKVLGKFDDCIQKIPNLTKVNTKQMPDKYDFISMKNRMKTARDKIASNKPNLIIHK